MPQSASPNPRGTVEVTRRNAQAWEIGFLAGSLVLAAIALVGILSVLRERDSSWFQFFFGIRNALPWILLGIVAIGMAGVALVLSSTTRQAPRPRVR